MEKYTNEFIKKFEPKIDYYYKLIHLNAKSKLIPIYIANELDAFLKEHKKDNNTTRLHEKHKLLKIWACHNILAEIGFDSVWDDKEINGYPYEKALEFCRNYYHKLSLLSGNYDKRNWDDYDIENKDSKRGLVLLLNTFLKNTLGITVANKFKGKKAALELYVIKGINDWKEANITIPKNIKADSLEEMSKPLVLKYKKSKWDSLLDTFVVEAKEIKVR
jgi:hypothetical protein